MKFPFKKQAKNSDNVSSGNATVQNIVLTEDINTATNEGRTQIASFVWTLVCVLYTVVSVILFVVNNWVPSKFNAALIALLAVWIVVFIVIVGVSLGTKNAGKGKKALAAYKKFIGIFKGLVNIMFLAISAVSMAGIAVQGFDGVVQLLMFVFTFVVAIVQVALKISIIVIKAVYKQRGKKIAVKVVTFIDGKQKENIIRTAAMKSLYGQKKDGKKN